MEKRKRGRPKTGRTYNGFGVYKITCLENSRIYIGGSNTVYNRLCNQKCRLRTASKACVPDMLSDFQKYGEAAFRFEIVKYCQSRIDFLRSEQKLIEEYRETGLLYNIVDAYVERVPKKKRYPFGQKFAALLPIRQKKFIDKASKECGISNNAFLEKLIDKYIKELEA